MTITEARELLGERYEGLTDAQISQIITELEQLSEIILESEILEKTDLTEKKEADL